MRLRRARLVGSALAASGLLGASILPTLPAFAAAPPHLEAVGPSHPLPVGATAVIKGTVEASTGRPLYQFRVGNKIVQRYSIKDQLSLPHLAAGSYTVTVRSLGMGQFRSHLFGRFRSATIHFTVGTPQLVAKGPAKGVAQQGTAFVRARVEDASAEPYFHFTLNGAVLQKYSHKNYVTLHHLTPGHYVVEVKSLGPAQYRNHAWGSARSKIITFTVPQPTTTTTAAHLSVASLSSLLANGTSKETLSVTATSSAGHPVANQPVTFISSDPNVATVSPSVATTSADGVATATVTAGSSAGTSTIQAVAGGVSSSTQITTSPEQSAPSLSAFQVTGQQAGQGSDTKPAIAASSDPVTVSTTLTRRDGRPQSGVNLTYTVMPQSKSMTLDGLAASSGGKTLSGSPVSGGGMSFVVATDSAGNARLTLTDSGHPLGATVSVSAPFASYKAASPVSLLWANPGTAILTPTNADSLFGSQQNPGPGVIPVTATVVAGPSVTTQNQSVTFTLKSGSSADAYLSSDSTGVSHSGRTLTMTTNQDGQATVYVDNVPPLSFIGTKQATLTATEAGHTIDNIDSATAEDVTLTWGSQGFPAALTLNSTAPSATTGSPLTISGTLTDVVGKPASNATLHLMPINSSGQPAYNDSDSYLQSGKSVAFSAGSPFDSVVTNANGEFSFTVSDTHSGSDRYEISYQPASGAVVTFGTAGQTTVTWQPSIQPARLAIAPSLSTLSSASDTEIVQTDENTAVSSYVGAFTANGSPVSLSASGLPSITYQLNAASGSALTSINGVSLPSPATSVMATILADGTVTVNGASMGSVSAGSSQLVFTADGTASGSRSVQVKEGSLSASMTLDVSGTPHTVVFNPTTILPSTVLNNGPVTETLTVEGSSGHPIPDAQIAIDGGTSHNAPGSFESGAQNDSVWVTKVNGSSLTTSINSQNRSDAFPLVDPATNLANLGYQYPATSSRIHFSAGAMEVTANSKGQITLTLRGGGASFWATANGQPVSSSNGATADVSKSLSSGTYGLGAWFHGAEIGSAVIGNSQNKDNGTAPKAQSLTAGSSTPLTFTFLDNAGQPLEDAPVALTAQGLSHATFGTSSTATQDTSSLAGLPTLMTNDKGQVTLYLVDKTQGDHGTLTASIDGLTLTSGTITIDS